MTTDAETQTIDLSIFDVLVEQMEADARAEEECRRADAEAARRVAEAG